MIHKISQMLIWPFPTTMKGVMIVGTLMRAVALLYGILIDRVWHIKYTDYDYKVFSDAALHVLQGESPYDRITYRYTPLLAYMMLPNFLLFYEFGKILFAIFDLACGYLAGKILTKLNVDPKTTSYAVGWWLLYPLSTTISTRGSADSLIVMLSLLTLYYILNEEYKKAAIIFGIAVHFKIYPIIYAIPFFLFIGSKNEKSEGPFSVFKWIYNKLFNMDRIKFAVLSAGVFIGLNYLFYKIYGFKFLYEAYLYHFVRKDHRHNMSFYFNSVHLLYDSPYAGIIGLTAFIPQWAMMLIVGVALHKDIGTCMFYQSFLFVIFNKVCTAQYFVWFVGLMPMIVPKNLAWIKSGITYWIIWAIWQFSETGMLVNAYKLEILGENTFNGIFKANAFFYIAGVGLLCTLLYNQQITNTWKEIEKKAT